MSCNQFKEIEIECELFERCERLILYGGSYTGKSHMLQSLVLRHHAKFKKIIICGTGNDLLKYPETRNKTEHYECDANPIYNPFGDQFIEDQKDDRQTLIILDDVMNEAFNSQIVSKMYSRGRHINLSVILVLQSFFPQGAGKSLIPMIKNNASVQIFFKLRNQDEMKIAARKLECEKSRRTFF